MSNLKERLRKKTNAAIAGAIEGTEWLAGRIIADAEKAEHARVARHLLNLLEYEGGLEAENGKSSVERTFLLYEVRKGAPNLADAVGSWSKIIAHKIAYNGLVADGLYEGDAMYKMQGIPETYHLKHKFALNPKIYANQRAFEELSKLLIEGLVPYLGKVLPENTRYDFIQKDLKLSVKLRLDW